jgi:hypothetical protein
LSDYLSDTLAQQKFGDRIKKVVVGEKGTILFEETSSIIRPMSNQAVGAFDRLCVAAIAPSGTSGFGLMMGN